MRKINYFSYLFIVLILVFTSCNNENEVISTENEKVAIEPEFVENDGLMEEGAKEEEAPIVHTKSYCSYYDNYSLLRPSGLTKADVDGIKCGETKEFPLLVGYYKKIVGKISVSNDGENLYISVRANYGKYMKKVYFYIGDKNDIPFYSDGYPRLNEFNYKAFPYYYGGQKKATYTIPLSSIDSDCFEIIAYAKIYDSYTGCYYSAFGYDANKTQTYYYSYYTGCYYFGEWVRSFEFCKQSCKIETYEAYAYKVLNPEHSFCFLDDGFSQWGWTNEFIHYWMNLYQNANPNYQFPLYVNANGCNFEEANQIGYVEIEVGSTIIEENTKLTYDIKYVITDSNYALSEVNLNTSTSKHAIDNNAQPTVSPEFYTYKRSLNNVSEYLFDNLDWPTSNIYDKVYIIPNAKVVKLN